MEKLKSGDKFTTYPLECTYIVTFDESLVSVFAMYGSYSANLIIDEPGIDKPETMWGKEELRKFVTFTEQ